MYGYLKTIRMLVLHPERQDERLLTTLMLWTADFVESQPFALRIVIIYYYFHSESWTTATSKIDVKKNIDYVTLLYDACSEWDKNHVFKERG